MSFTDVLQGEKDDYGNRAYIDFLNRINVYDFSEFFVYVFLIPLVVLGVVKLCPYLWCKLKKVASLIIRRYRYANDIKTTISEDSQTSNVIKENGQHSSERIKRSEEKENVEKDVNEYYLKKEIEFLDSKYNDFKKNTIKISSWPFLKDYYLILEIDTEATTEDIEKAFKRKFNKYRLKEKELRKYQEVREAYTILSHQETKSLYDKELMAYNESGDYENYLIKEKHLACIISKLQTNANEKHGKLPKFASKIGKGCLWLIILILLYFVSTCINAYMTQQGRDSVKRSYSNLESNY